MSNLAFVDVCFLKSQSDSSSPPSECNLESVWSCQAYLLQEMPEVCSLELSPAIKGMTYSKENENDSHLLRIRFRCAVPENIILEIFQKCPFLHNVFVRNFRRVCLQFWLSVRNFV